MTDIPPPATPAGWYPDGVADQVRWWDGAQWTEQVAAATAVRESPSGPASVRGVTGHAEIDGTTLLYRPKPDRPPLLRIDLHTVEALVVSANRDTFDVVLVGARGRRSPSLFSETSLRRNPLTPRDEWAAFVERLAAAIATALPKFRKSDLE